MHFEIEKDLLLEGLSKVVPIAEKRSTLPILSHVLVNASDNSLVLTATDLEVGLEMVYNCNVLDPGIIAIPSKKFLEIVRELKSGIVTFELSDNQRMKIISGVSVFEIAGMKADDFPAFSKISDAETTTLKAQDLAYMIDKTLFAASSDESRFNLNGVLVEFDENATRMVSTDGHRLALVDKDMKLGLKGQPLVPKKGLHELKRIIDGLDKDLEFGFEPKNLFVKTDKFTMSIRLIDGEYPPYRKVIPQTSEMRVIAERILVIQALRRVAVLASDRNKGVSVTVRPGEMEISIIQTDLGTAKDIVPIDYDGDDLELFINVYYLLDALNVIDTEKIVFEFNQGGLPLIMRPEPDKNYFNLVMPMRK
jgi:DNA polymerase III subunit beta